MDFSEFLFLSAMGVFVSLFVIIPISSLLFRFNDETVAFLSGLCVYVAFFIGCGYVLRFLYCNAYGC
jgi:hypothetical protein